jgi:hypothetical protein
MSQTFKILAIVWIVISILLFIPFTFDKIKEKKVKSGKTYKRVLGGSNPFEKPMIRYYRVIDTRDGYVQYIDSLRGDTLSDGIGLFMVGTEEVKK